MKQYRRIDEFFAFLNSQWFAVTFDDVRLRTDYSEVDFNLADLRSRFSMNIDLKIPVTSAAMDRVTERETAIAMASIGGLGIIQRNLNPEAQSEEVQAVKKHLNGMIEDPITVQHDQSLHQILEMCEERQYSFRSFPVLDAEGKLIGMLTGNDIDHCENSEEKVSKIMTKNVIKGTPSTTLDEAYKLMREKNIKALPLVGEDGRVAGLYIWSDLRRILDKTALHNTDEKGQLRVGAAVGTDDGVLERVKLLVRRGVDVIVIDAAHGDSKRVMDTFTSIKQEYSSLDVVVGNISEYDSARRLVAAGVDGIKVGQGGGSICTSRIVTGMGTPQVTAIYNCSQAVRVANSDIPVCADGGIRHPGDISIAIAAGADSVMLGMVLAGTTESPGNLIPYRGGFVKEYRGMGSLKAMQENPNSRNRYGEKQTSKSLILPEGVEGYVPFVGPLAEVLHRNMEGLRRGMGEAGAANIQQFQQNARMYRVSSAGMHESHPHDIIMEKWQDHERSVNRKHPRSN